MFHVKHKIISRRVSRETVSSVYRLYRGVSRETCFAANMFKIWPQMQPVTNFRSLMVFYVFYPKFVF